MTEYAPWELEESLIILLH